MQCEHCDHDISHHFENEGDVWREVECKECVEEVATGKSDFDFVCNDFDH